MPMKPLKEQVHTKGYVVVYHQSYAQVQNKAKHQGHNQVYRPVQAFVIQLKRALT